MFGGPIDSGDWRSVRKGYDAAIAIASIHDEKTFNIINKKNRTKLTRGRKVKVSGYKKAIITLKKGQSIDLTTGI